MLVTDTTTSTDTNSAAVNDGLDTVLKDAAELNAASAQQQQQGAPGAAAPGAVPGEEEAIAFWELIAKLYGKGAAALFTELADVYGEEAVREWAQAAHAYAKTKNVNVAISPGWNLFAASIGFFVVPVAMASFKRWKEAKAKEEREEREINPLDPGKAAAGGGAASAGLGSVNDVPGPV